MLLFQYVSWLIHEHIEYTFSNTNAFVGVLWVLYLVFIMNRPLY